MRILCIFFMGLVVSSTSAQTRLTMHQYLDSSELVLVNFSDAYTRVSDQEIDPHDVDMELLNASIFYTINALREKSRCSLLTYDSTIDVMAHYAVSCSPHSCFKKKHIAKRRFNRQLVKAKVSHELPCGIFKAAYTSAFIMGYKGRKPYFLYQETEELVYGKKSEVDSNFIAVPIEKHTYKSLSKQIVHIWMKQNKREILSKYHQMMSVRCIYDSQTKKKKKVPEIKAVIVLGSPRIVIKS